MNEKICNECKGIGRVAYPCDVCGNDWCDCGSQSVVCCPVCEGRGFTTTHPDMIGMDADPTAEGHDRVHVQCDVCEGRGFRTEAEVYPMSCGGCGSCHYCCYGQA